ncbi:hypothetical protein lerEdw1_020896 [Lerista edwardsae]|nr:hypothetical protein lerEdw1_020896 [Lerista edwardsae]
MAWRKAGIGTGGSSTKRRTEVVESKGSLFTTLPVLASGLQGLPGGGPRMRNSWLPWEATGLPASPPRSPVGVLAVPAGLPLAGVDPASCQAPERSAARKYSGCFRAADATPAESPAQQPPPGQREAACLGAGRARCPGREAPLRPQQFVEGGTDACLPGSSPRKLHWSPARLRAGGGSGGGSRAAFDGERGTCWLPGVALSARLLTQWQRVPLPSGAGRRPRSEPGAVVDLSPPLRTLLLARAIEAPLAVLPLLALLMGRS